MGLCLSWIHKDVHMRFVLQSVGTKYHTTLFLSKDRGIRHITRSFSKNQVLYYPTSAVFFNGMCKYSNYRQMKDDLKDLMTKFCRNCAQACKLRASDSTYRVSRRNTKLTLLQQMCDGFFPDFSVILIQQCNNKA